MDHRLVISLALSMLSCLAGFLAAQDVEEVARRLRSDDDRERREAVQALAHIATPEAWRHVLDALLDEEARVADEAQLQLGKAQDATLVPELLGKRGLGSRRGIVALRAAELIGRLSMEVAAKDLADALAHKDAAVRATLLWTVSRLAVGGHVEGLPDKLIEVVRRLMARDRDPFVRGCALEAWVALQEAEAYDALKAAVADEEPALRCAAVRSSGVLDDATRLALLDELAGDPAYGVRARVAVALTEVASREAIGLLVEMLKSESAERLSWSIVRDLRQLSGLKHGRDPRPWRDWLATLGPDWRPGKPRRSEAEQGGTAAFVGMPVLSQRVAFLIDLSGSMWSERDDGTVRKDRVEEELRRLLPSLPADTLFNVIPYTDDPLPWQKKVVEATPANVKKAITAFEKQKARGKGDFWDALSLALEDPQVDTVMVLTDGAPTGGDRWNLNLMRDLLQHENRYRNVVVDALLFDSKDYLERLWQNLCEGTGGRCQAVDL